jgi:hypothetical protein
MASLKLCTFNMHGFYNGIDFVNELCDNCDIICLQEHWLRTQSLSVFNINSEFSVLSYSSMDDDALRESGRPYGGLALLYRSANISIVNDFGQCVNKRVSCAMLECYGVKHLLFNVYFPCVGDLNYCSSIDMICAFIESILKSINLLDVHVVIAGDFNVNLLTSNSVGLGSWGMLCSTYNLHPCTSQYKGSVNYTFRSDKRQAKSFIDNIVISHNLFDDNRSVEVDVLDDVTNNSDHLALVCQVKILNSVCTNVYSKVSSDSCYENIKRYVWSDLAKKQYLSDTGYAFKCLYETVFKKCDIHYITANDIDRMYEGIVSTLRLCSSAYMRVFKRNKKLKWSSYLEQLKIESRDAYRSWSENGCPNFGHLWNNYIASRRTYKRAVRENKKNNNVASAQKMLDAWSCGDSKKFWQSFKCNTGCGKNVSANNLCAEQFAEKFKDSFIDSTLNEQALRNFVNNAVNMQNVENDCIFTVECIEKAVLCLSKSEAMDCDALTISHVIYAHPLLYVLLNALFNSMVICGLAPSRFGHSVVFPTVKSVNKPLNDADNYRPISIIAILAKVFEACVLSVSGDSVLSFSKNQFGFVRDGGCSKAIFAVNTCVKYFNERGSNVYLCTLDASKAFDRVNHYFLFNCMIERGVHPGLVKVFMSWLRNMKSCVSWQNVLSSYFYVRSGVPQGSILGGRFFNMLMDKLLLTIENTELGCYVNSQFAGAIAYADDLVIMSASIVHTQALLDACVQFGATCDVKFNVLKSSCACIGELNSTNKLPNMLLDSLMLQWVDKFTYLGAVFQAGKTLKMNCKPRVQKFISSVCSVLRNKVIGYETVFVDILIKKCLPVLFYGMECTFLDKQSVKSLSQAWNLSFRWLFNYRKYDSTRLLFLSYNTMSMKYLLDQRMLYFYLSIRNSNNILLHNMLLCMYGEHEFLTLHKNYDLLIRYCGFNDIKRSVFAKFMCYCVEKM